MITSKKIINLIENFFKAKVVGKKTVNIYENPSIVDITEIIKSAREHQRKVSGIRFIADAKNKKVYAADDYVTTHDEMNKILGFPSGGTKFLENPHLFQGRASINNGRAIMKSWENRAFLKFGDDRAVSFCKNTFKYDWSFANDYINGCSSYINSEKEQYDT